ncbi:MAG: hypothetical protein HS104_18310 [Polyangiaceae bacterium]|nr:hypothetical protein [Polyangiaceae bacterium]MCE7892875.1 hypothetical protein [Sorangiineae bacterium PRO1]MCL4753928.1 hypothetical protein [Myxococcales bacterium]
MSGSAGTVTCTRCGGAVALEALLNAVTCPYCGAHVELRPDEVERLVHYRHEVRGRLQGAARELEHAESWNRWYGGADAKRKHHFLVPIVLWVGLIVLLGGVSMAADAFGLARGAGGKLLPLLMFVLMFSVMGGYMLWFYSGRGGRAKAAVLASATVSCPKCGAPHALRPGEVLDHCRFCAAPLLPNQRVMEHGRAEAERALFSAELERSRAERRGMTALSASSGARSTPYIVIGSFLPMTLLGSVGFTVSFAMGRERGPIGGLFVLWALAGANVGLLGLIYLYRSHRQDQLDRALRPLLSRFLALPLSDAWAMNGWLDRHWAGSVPVQQMFRGPYFSAVAGAAQGYPMLVVANPVGASDDYPGFVSVRLAAWLSMPDSAANHPAAVAARAHFEQLGFSLSWERAGPVALAVHGAARRWVASGDGQRLADAVERLGHALRALGATPVDVASPPV